MAYLGLTNRENVKLAADYSADYVKVKLQEQYKSPKRLYIYNHIENILGNDISVNTHCHFSDEVLKGSE